MYHENGNRFLLEQGIDSLDFGVPSWHVHLLTWSLSLFRLTDRCLVQTSGTFTSISSLFVGVWIVEPGCTLEYRDVFAIFFVDVVPFWLVMLQFDRSKR
jgi:hypothetical protein